MKIPHLFKADFTAPRQPARLLRHEDAPACLALWRLRQEGDFVFVHLQNQSSAHVSPGDKELPSSDQTEEICLEQARGQPGPQNLATGILARQWFDLTFQKL